LVDNDCFFLKSLNGFCADHYFFLYLQVLQDAVLKLQLLL